MRIKANRINITFIGPNFSLESVIKWKKHFVRIEKANETDSMSEIRCGGVVRRKTFMQHTTDAFFYLCIKAREEIRFCFVRLRFFN